MNIYAHPLPRVYAIFLFAIEYSAKAQWHTDKIAYTLGRGWAYISDMSSTSGNMGAKHFEEFGPSFFDIAQILGGPTITNFDVRCSVALANQNCFPTCSRFGGPSPITLILI